MKRTARDLAVVPEVNQAAGEPRTFGATIKVGRPRDFPRDEFPAGTDVVLKVTGNVRVLAGPTWGDREYCIALPRVVAVQLLREVLAHLPPVEPLAAGG